jgi:hypothetical protein
MNSENVKNITNQTIEQFIEALQAGKSKALTSYLAAVAKFHRYTFQNILLIARQCPQAASGQASTWPFREAILQMSEARTLLIDYWMGHANGEMSGRYVKQLLESVWPM